MRGIYTYVIGEERGLKMVGQAMADTEPEARKAVKDALGRQGISQEPRLDYSVPRESEDNRQFGLAIV